MLKNAETDNRHQEIENRRKLLFSSLLTFVGHSNVKRFQWNWTKLEELTFTSFLTIVISYIFFKIIFYMSSSQLIQLTSQKSFSRLHQF